MSSTVVESQLHLSRIEIELQSNNNQTEVKLKLNWSRTTIKLKSNQSRIVIVTTVSVRPVGSVWRHVADRKESLVQGVVSLHLALPPVRIRVVRDGDHLAAVDFHLLRVPRLEVVVYVHFRLQAHHLTTPVTAKIYFLQWSDVVWKEGHLVCKKSCTSNCQRFFFGKPMENPT